MDPLIITEGKAPATAKGDLGVVMLIRSAEGEDSQWFSYSTGYFSPATTVEWDKDTMSAVLPADVGSYLIKRGYARVMTAPEVQAYNERLEEEATRPSSPQKTEKGKP